MVKRTILFCVLAIGLLMQACYYDNETVLYKIGSGGTACDTTNVTYAGSIVPIMASNCNSCHTVSSGNGVVTADFANLKIIVTNGKLVKSVNWTAGAIQMPLGGQKLSICDLTKIGKWVSSGALNN